jgi:membrane protease YdiL (CAAX protease family)
VLLEISGLAYLAVLLWLDVVWAPRVLARVKERIAAGDPDARPTLYQRVIALDWIAAAIALAILFAGGASAAEIGLRAPDGDALARYAGLLGGAAIGIVIGAIVMLRRPQQKVIGDIDALIPRTSRERWWFAGLAMTAGITEEVFYRALPIVVLAHLLPDAQPWLLVAITAASFGVAHIYQGIAGVLATAALGGVLGGIYVATHSLVPAMALHAAIDLRMLAVRRQLTQPNSPSAGG